MADVERVSSEEARQRATASGALLVCAYDDEAKCSQIRLERAISLSELERRAQALPRDQELIFYCA